MRKRLFEIIELSKGSDIWSRVYDIFMMVMILLSIIPLAFKQDTTLFSMIETAAVVIFIIDYILRLSTADLKYGKRSVSSFLRYPFSFLAIVDLLSILPSVAVLNQGFRLLRIFRLVRTFRIFRIFKVLRYSKSFTIILAVFKKQKEALIAVIVFAFAYIMVSALVIYNVEPNSFDSFFSAVYWATASLTTIGYGDIYPITTVGRIVTMVSAIFGIAIIALPSGIITAGYLKEVNKRKENDEA